MNLEMKVPDNADIKQLYNWREAVKNLHTLIQEMQMVQYCFISNFDHGVLRYFEEVNGLYILNLPKED